MKRLRRWWANPAGLCATCAGTWNRHDDDVIHRDGSVSCASALQVLVNRAASAWYPIGGVALEGGTYHIGGTINCRTNPAGYVFEVGGDGDGVTIQGGHFVGMTS